MSGRTRGISLPELSFLRFDPTAEAADKKMADPGEAGRPKDTTMEAIPQSRPRAKQVSFGLADPHSVVDLDKAVLPAEVAAERQQTAEATAHYRHHGRVEMTARQWEAIQPNPRQRDTEAHAKKAKHLKAYDPIHRFVSMARTPDGQMWKLDGHTRSWLWSRGEVEGPATLYVEVYLCDDVEAVKNLYSKFDSQVAVETGADKIVGAAREHGLVFATPMLRSGRYGSAVKRLYMYTTKTWGAWSEAQFVYDAVGFYKDELRRLDALTPQTSVFSSGITMAALATFKRRGVEPIPFWTAYSENRGQKSGTRMDGVEALRHALADVKLSTAKRMAEGGGALQMGLLGKGILAYESYRLGRTYTAGKGGGIRSMDDDVLKEYLRRSVEG